MDSVVLTLYCSNEAGSVSFGAWMKGKLPCPVIFTVKVPAELAASWSAESDASMENLPTAPVKLAGAPAGSSLTVMFTRGVCNLRRRL